MSEKFGIRDFFLIAIIGLLIFRINACSPHSSNSSVNLPQLSKVEKTIAKDKTVQTVIPQTVLKPEQMKQDTKSIAKNLGIDKVNTVTKTVTIIKYDTTHIPVFVDENKHTIVTAFNNKDISITHTLHTDNNTGDFHIALTPDTTTFVTGIKTHWFKKDEYQIFVNHSNSLFNDTLASSYTFKPNKEWLVIGPSFGVGMRFDTKFSFYPTVGLTATIPIIRFRKKN